MRDTIYFWYEIDAIVACRKFLFEAVLWENESGEMKSGRTNAWKCDSWQAVEDGTTVHRSGVSAQKLQGGVCSRLRLFEQVHEVIDMTKNW